MIQVHRHIYDHCAYRLQERYGMELTWDMYCELCCKIKSGCSQIIKSLGKQKTVREIHYRGNRIRLIWNMRRSCIHTFLPVRSEYVPA